LALFAQTGNYYINNYTPAMYGAGEQNWNIIQDSLGRLFVANTDAVMMYDGKYWKIIQAGDATVYSINKTNKGVLIVGGDGDFGNLNFNPDGDIKYNSLSSSLPVKEKEFGKIWAIHTVDSNHFFCSNEKVFWYRNNTFIKSFKPSGEKFHTFFTVENTLLVREQGVGFVFFKDGQLKRMTNSEEFADAKVYAILHFKNNLYWICSRKGVFILKYNKKHPELSSFSKINAPFTDQWMFENDLYCGAKINDNLYALGSIKQGVLLVDNAFNPVSHINTNQSGLQEDAVKCIYIDYAGDMWLALNKGVSHVQINTPITHWNKINGIRGTIESVAKLNGTFYIASDKGVDKLSNTTNMFSPTIIADPSWDLMPYNSILLAATSNSIYEITETTEKKIFDAEDGAFKLFSYPLDKEKLFIAGENSLFLTKYQDHKITILKEYPYAKGIRSIVADTKGNVFFGGEMEAYMFDPKLPDTLSIFDKKDGIDSTVESHFFNYKKGVFVAGKGIFKFHENTTPHFIKDSIYNIFKGNLQMTKAIQVGDDIWMAMLNISENMTTVDGDGMCILKHTSSGFIKDYKFFKQISYLKPHCFLVDTDKVYIGTNDGLISYDFKQIHKDYAFHTFISKMMQKGDTNVVNENFYEGIKYVEPIYTYKYNNILVFPAASDFDSKGEIEFAHYLEGLEEDYNGFSKLERINYNNLHEGHYTLHIKSRNVLGIEGKPISYSFIILPPWFRTYWAYITYLVVLVLSITIIVRYNTKRLKEQNVKLEKIITERTKEVEHQKQEIQEKNKEITDSINYAQRIQQAILAPITEIKKVYKDLFVFFQPKDIVSGDFYWFHKISDTEILIACADCTGHGVPGGFMSMICSDKLNDAAQKTYDPAEILFHVNNNVKKALRQAESAEEGANKDGMEIALVRIDFAAKKIWYAGANRLLWILKKDAQDIEETKPTKASIASFTKPNFKYDGHEFQLSAGDLVYITSDGFPDQFGGPDGKKFMSKSMKKLILSIRNNSIPEQEKTIRDTINQWMDGYEQVDDLLVIAFRL
jgi:serine phosphatase RsbU (regulator of sigma subunit)/ligand-binding sensor domain-containing protein